MEVIALERLDDGQFAVGHTAAPGAGRPKGSLNRTTKALRDVFLNALDELGGVEYLVGYGRENPQHFISLLSKMLPRELCLDVSGQQAALTGQVIADLKRRALDDGLCSDEPCSTGKHL